MAARPSPRAPHSSTCAKLSAALSPSRRPVSGLEPASEPLARAPMGSFGHSPCTGLTIARGPGLQRPVLPAARGREEGGESAGPALRRAARTTAEATERAGRGGTCAQATPPQGHAHWPGCPGLGGRGLQGGGPLAAAGFCSSLHVGFNRSSRFLSAPLLRFWASSSCGSLLSLIDLTEISLLYLNGAALLPFPVTSFRRANSERPLNFLQGKVDQGKFQIQDAPNSHRSI